MMSRRETRYYDGEDSPDMANLEKGSHPYKEEDIERGEPKPATVPPKYSLFDPALSSERKWMGKYILLIILVMFCVILGLLPVYWGSFYQRESRIGNLKVNVYNMDKGGDGLDGVVGDAVVKSLIPGTLGWQVKTKQASLDDAKEAVHEQEAWISVYIPENATSSLYNAFKTADNSFNKSSIITVVIESQRDLSTSSVYTPIISKVEKAFQGQGAQIIYQPILKSLSSSEQQKVMSDAPNLMLAPIMFTQVDLSVYKPAILVAVLQVGLIYLIIIAFFQFNFFSPLHQRISPQITPKWNLLLRVAISLLSYFFVSLSLALVSLAFQIDMTVSYGKAGFMVFWMTLLLTIIALGQAIENLALLAIAYWPPGFGFILLFFVVTQIAPSFSALDLCPRFYHYGWIFPIFNAGQILRVILVGTTDKDLGKNYGIIVAWIVLDYILYPFCLMVFGKRMAKKPN